MTLCVTELDFLKKKFFFWSQNWEKGPKMSQKQNFLNLLKNLVINIYWIYSIMKKYLVFCVAAQVPYLGKFLFLRYGPKCSQPIRLQDFFINHISRRNQWNSVIFGMLMQIHINQKLIKNGCGQSVHETLKSVAS